MLLKTICTVYFFMDAAASVKIDNKSPFNKNAAILKKKFYLIF